MFEAGTLARDELNSRISQADDPSLTAFLLKAGMNSAKVPKGSKPMKDRCVKWAAEEIAERRPFVLLTTQELKEKYRQIKGATPKSKWNAADLIVALRPRPRSTTPRASLLVGRVPAAAQRVGGRRATAARATATSRTT